MRRFSLWHRPVLLALCLALLSTVLLSGLLVAQARGQSSVLQPAGPHRKLIDWEHPIRTQPVHSHSGHQGDLPSGTVPVYVPPKTGLAVYANFPSNCYRSYAYYVIVNGQTSWSAWSGNEQATVYYMWCPRWSGDSIGINWSYGIIYQLSGCTTISVGGPIGQEVGGALIEEANLPWPDYADDEESITGYWTCAGGDVWDDSLTLPGDGLYKVWMFDDNQPISVNSPCFC